MKKLSDGTTGHPANTVTFVDASDQTKGRASQQQKFVFANQAELDAYLANIKKNANLATVNVNGTNDKLSSKITTGSDATFLNGKHNITGTAYDGNYGLLAGTYSVTGKVEYLTKDKVVSTFHIIEKLPTGNKVIWILTATQYKIATKNDLTGVISDYKYQDPSGHGTGTINTYDMSGNKFSCATIKGSTDKDKTMGTGSYDPAPAGYTINLNESSLPSDTDPENPLHIKYDHTNHIYSIDIYRGSQATDSFPEGKDFYIDYTANKQTVRVRYMDGNKEVAHEDFNGHTGETTNLTFDKVPANYDVIGSLPSTSYTFTADSNQVITINLKHQMENLPDSKTVTRTINVITPDGKTKTTVQKVDLSRTNVRDKVTGEITNGDWSKDHFAEFDDIPAVAGYTPSQTKVEAQDVDGTTPDSTVTITYTANAQTGKISYIDQKTNEEIKSNPLTGVTDGDVAIKLDVPAGYHLVSG